MDSNDSLDNITDLTTDYNSSTLGIVNITNTPTTTTVPAPTLSPYDEYLFTTILWVVHHVLDPVVLSLGLVGNILAFLVLFQPKYRNQTTCLYMRILAVFDTSIILLKNSQVSTGFLLSPWIMPGESASDATGFLPWPSLPPSQWTSTQPSYITYTSQLQSLDRFHRQYLHSVIRLNEQRFYGFPVVQRCVNAR